MRILEAQSVKVNEMVLTGESAEVSKAAHLTDEDCIGKLTLPNMLYGSTSLVEGRVKGVVLLTGMSSRVGSIASLLGGSTEEKAPRPHDSVRLTNARVYLDPFGDESREDDEEEEEEDGDVEDGLHASGEHSGVLSRQSSSAAHSSVMSAWYCGHVYKWIVDQIKAIRPKRTPLQDELHSLGMTMTAVALCSACLVVGIGIARGFRDPANPDNPPWLQSLMLAVSMSVSAIPEGLPLVVVICFALGTSAMAKKNTLIRRLPAVETLGSASIICSDKTGTLTSGKMSATQVWTCGHVYTISGDGYNPRHGCVSTSDGETRTIGHAETPLKATMQVANLCSDAVVRFDADTHRWKPIGTSTETAMVVASEKFGIVTSDNREARPPKLVIPFSSRLKMMAIVLPLVGDDAPIFLQTPAEGDVLDAESEGVSTTAEGLCALAKGAPHAILDRCRFVLRTDEEGVVQVVPLTPELLSIILQECDRLSEAGLRVLALCYRRVNILPDVESATADVQFNTVVQDMTFCGLMGMMDPPRPGVRKAVARAKQGGVRTVMITGDYLKTATSIAKMVGILEPSMDEGEGAVDCSVLRPYGDYLSPRELDAITWHAFVFARARPEDKIQIVKSFQRQDFVVAMTGDGVNDAPALRQADIGVAMGITGSEVAKAASDMILTDDKFTSIVDAVELGRTIYSNLRKFVMYLIGSNWTQILVILTAILLGVPTPLEPLQILFVNLITDGMPAIALSIERPEGDVMRERPRKKREKILSGHIIHGIVGHSIALMFFMIFIYFLGLWWNTGRVFLANMYNSDGELITTCEVLNSTGEWVTVHSEHCIENGLANARTMVFLTIAFAESLRPLTARSFSLGVFDEFFRNKHMTRAVIFSISCIFFITCTPVVQDIFHLHPPRWFEWLLVFVGVIVTIVSDEMLKHQLRWKREEDRKWLKLLTHIQSMQMELRNINSHVTRVESLTHV